MRLAPTNISRSKSVNSRRAVIITSKPLHMNNLNRNESSAKALRIYTCSTRCYCHLKICILISHDFCHFSVYIYVYVQTSHINVTTTYFRRQREITNHKRQWQHIAVECI
ncbi:hypothetical protein CDAR_449261 [Caerostris darwini]|uniref:Uncharacterized protein n=1 Tax=Caerostris darwini TaxID=1538125 RepID=A0AAV4QV16_9ARAC|nr:hypothetical protein CDAR_449261 [Caerostris darwini]